MNYLTDKEKTWIKQLKKKVVVSFVGIIVSFICVIGSIIVFLKTDQVSLAWRCEGFAVGLISYFINSIVSYCNFKRAFEILNKIS